VTKDIILILLMVELHYYCF